MASSSDSTVPEKVEDATAATGDSGSYSEYTVSEMDLGTHTDSDEEDSETSTASEGSGSRSPRWKKASKKSDAPKVVKPKVGLYPTSLAAKPKKRKVRVKKTKVEQEKRPPDADGFYYVCKVRDLPLKKGVKAKVNKRALAVFRLADGTIHVMENACSHQGVGLACGSVVDVEDTTYVKCPGHNVKFSIATGKAKRGKWKQKMYPTKIKHSELWVRV